MPRYKFIVLSRPVEGREAEYNDWYQNLHLRQVVAIAGFKSAQRFRLTENMAEGTDAQPYAAVYEIETDNLAATLDELKGRAGGESLLVSDALDMATIFASVYEEFGAEAKAP